MIIHKIIKRYRVLYIIITIFFMWLGYDAWDWFKDNHGGLSQYSVAGFVSIYLAVIGALKYVLENSRQDDKHDD